MKTKTILDAIVFLLMLLFIYASVFKLLDLDNFERYFKSALSFGKLSGTAAVTIPIMELGVAGLLFVQRFRLFGLYASFILMFMFTVYIGYMSLFVEKKPCSCGGILNNMGWKEHLIFNIAFTVIAVIGIFLHTRLERKEYKTSPSY